MSGPQAPDGHRRITVTWRGSEHGASVMTIRKTSLGREGPEYPLVGRIDCMGRVTGVTITLSDLDVWVRSEVDSDSRGHRKGSGYGIDLINDFLTVVGVNSWEELAGKQLIVLWHDPHGGAGSLVVGAQNLLDDTKMIMFRDHYQQHHPEEDNA